VAENCCQLLGECITMVNAPSLHASSCSELHLICLKICSSQRTMYTLPGNPSRRTATTDAVAERTRPSGA
jgi:hypothetical protein